MVEASSIPALPYPPSSSVPRWHISWLGSAGGLGFIGPALNPYTLNLRP